MKVSVIIPAFDVGPVIEQCLRSLRQQSSTDFECIIIDDASSDQTREVVQRVISDDRRFRLVTNIRNMGPSSCRNTGLAIARGTYVAFVDADDWIDALALERLLEFSEAHDLDYCFSSHNEYIERRSETRKKNPRLVGDRVFSGADLFSYVENYVNNPCEYYGLVHCWGRLYRRRLLAAQNVKFDDDLSQMEDVSFNFSFLQHCERVGYVDGYVYVHRIPAKGSLGSTKGLEPGFELKLLRAMAPVEAFLIARMGWSTGDAKRRLGHFYSSMAIVSILRLSRVFFAHPTVTLYRRIRSLIIAAATQAAIQCYQPRGSDSRFLGVAIRWRLTSLALLICFLKRTFRVAL